ncbi:hypothetical protein BHE90_007061 [Fusarium euwallaceae]|uniref:MOSC domain-containing protein n=1 Tax=Fusarium euwallaceae TaxID=1147111 RepID=A0A430LRV2_9HYPO|nr:hypothetical protein BHE90_007061 [Fusarium euwallaceae]
MSLTCTTPALSTQLSSPSTTFVPLPPKDVILSLRTGKIRNLGTAKIRSAINKHPRNGKVLLNSLGFDGDEQAHDTHGGPDKAVMQYCSRHYETWNEEAPGRAHLFQIGGFGENISSAYMSEDNVCIGDTFRLGSEVILQVSLPRQPCFKLNHRFQYKKASSSSQNSGRTGWYYRVIKPGHVEVGDELELEKRINPTWSVSRVQQILYHDTNNREALLELCRLPGLADELVQLFTSRLTKGVEDMSGRLGAIPMEWRSFKLIEKTALTPRICKFIFAEVDKDPNQDVSLPPFPHVRLKFGPDFCYTRAYSVVSGDLGKFELGIARADNSRGGSHFLHREAKVGDVFEVASGKASPKLDSKRDPRPTNHIFVIGGIGITAFMLTIKSLLDASASLEIHYAVRSRRDAAYLDQLPIHCTAVYAKDEARRLNLDTIIPPWNESDSPVKIYSCGPSSLLKALKNCTTAMGYPSTALHFESFEGPEEGPMEPFEVQLKSTKQILPVPAKKSLLDVLKEAGFDVESSCHVGNCGTCMVDLVQGDVDHRGVALDDEQKKSFMLSCVSRGRGRIVIDCD